MKTDRKSKKSTKKEKKPKKGNGIDDVLDRRVKKNIIAVLLIMLALVMLLSLVDLAGMAGQHIDRALSFMFGWGRFLLPVVMIILGALYFRKMEPIRYTLAAIGAVLFYVMFLGLMHFFKDLDVMVAVAKVGEGGGYVGLATAYPLAKFLGKIAGFIILLGFSLIGIMLIFNASLHHVFNQIKNRLKPLRSEADKEIASEEQQQKETEEEQEDLGENIKAIEFVEGPQDEEGGKEMGLGVTSVANAKVANQNVVRNIYNSSNWKRPPIDIFAKSKERPHQKNLEENVDIIKDTLRNFGINVEPSEYHIGPTVTQYTFRPAVGVKLSRIMALQKDLALALAAEAIRIEAPIPGKSLVGVEVPNKKKSIVRMRSMLESDVFKNKPSKLSIILGEDVNGHPILANIEKMPHLLIAGATNTGKSISINALLSTLLYENSPEELRIILIDPKRVELSMYNDIPHLLTPVIVDMTKVVHTLKWAISEMELRYKALQGMGARNIESYNDKVISLRNGNGNGKKEEKLEKMPYILIVIDELSDIMTAHGRDVEALIVRLAQMARAVGIHLIVSTQRPSVEVITGLIKANIITRIAFQVASHIDSRTILDMAGAEKLLGNGDLLYVDAESAQPRRIQGIYISELEVKKLVKSIKKQAKRVKFAENENLSESLDEQLDNATGTFSGLGTEGNSDDELYEQAKQLVIEAKKASTSMLQRRLRIGYARAARIVDMLEEKGIVGPPDGAKPRELLIGTTEKSVEYEDKLDDQKKREKWE